MGDQLILAADEFGWTATAQALGSVATVVVGIAGFIFVWLQIRGLRQALQSEANAKIYAEDADIMKIFIGKPHLRRYFFDNAEAPPEGSPDYDEVRTIAHLTCCHFEHVLLQLNNLPEFVRQGWVDYARYLYQRSPVIRSSYPELRDANVYVKEMDAMLFDTGPFMGPGPGRTAHPPRVAKAPAR